MDKKGVSEKTMLYVFYLLIFVLIFTSIAIWINGTNSPERVNRIYYSGDLAMLMTQFYGFDDGLEVVYRLDPCFDITITENEVLVKSKDKAISKGYIVSDGFEESISYASNGLIKEITFVKEEGEIKVKEQKECTN